MQISVGDISLTCFLILELSLNMKKRSAADDVAYEDISYKKSKKKTKKLRVCVKCIVGKVGAK